MLKDVITRLCQDRGITIKNLEKSIGLANSSISRWDKVIPRIDNVQKVANYFGVSVDYLLQDDCEQGEQKQIEERRTSESRRRQEDNDANLILQELTTIIKNFGGEKISTETRKIPLVGTIKCGTNGIAYEDIDAFVLIDESIHGELFALRTKGDSMQGRGIEEGDIAIIRKQEELENGQIGAFLIDGEEATLKRFSVIPNGVALESFNPNCPTRYFVDNDVNRLKILGRLVEIRKRF